MKKGTESDGRRPGFLLRLVILLVPQVVWVAAFYLVVRPRELKEFLMLGLWFVPVLLVAGLVLSAVVIWQMESRAESTD